MFIHIVTSFFTHTYIYIYTYIQYYVILTCSSLPCSWLSWLGVPAALSRLLCWCRRMWPSLGEIMSYEVLIATPRSVFHNVSQSFAAKHRKHVATTCSNNLQQKKSGSVCGNCYAAMLSNDSDDVQSHTPWKLTATSSALLEANWPTVRYYAVLPASLVGKGKQNLKGTTGTTNLQEPVQD